MSRLSIAAAALALVFGVGSLAAPSEAPAAKKLGKRTLKRGMKGKDVRILQRKLTKLKLRTRADGHFGKRTRRNVRKLERRYRWRVDGKVQRKQAWRIIWLVRQQRKRKLNRAARNRISGLFFVNGLSQPAVTVTATRAGTATLRVVDVNNGLAAYAFELEFGSAGSTTVSWNGWTAAGIWAPDSGYRFEIQSGTAGASLTGGQKARPFLFRSHAFPVGNPHNFGGSQSRFGAPRAGHSHQGHDVFAPCGTKMFAAEGGKVTTKAYQGNGAGYYLVVRGFVSGTDHVYMHLKKASWAGKGQRVYAGQQIGKVGKSGNASGCHLHYERWTAPGWYSGGKPFDPLPGLRYWDQYS